jgi:hypothetical protein
VKFRRLPRRFKRTVYALDSTTIKLFTCLRAVLWQRRHLLDGTAGGTFRMQWAPPQAFLPGFGGQP